MNTTRVFVVLSVLFAQNGAFSCPKDFISLSMMAIKPETGPAPSVLDRNS
jgi:hypothetical protein